MLEESLDECVVHPDGTFRLSAELNETRLALLSIGFQEALIYLEPGKSYELLVNYDKTREQITFVNKPYLQLQFRNLPSDDLNMQMAEFNSRADQFLIANFNRIFKSKNRMVINEFRKELEETFQNPSPYLNASIHYRLASIEYSSGLIEKAALYESYFKNHKIRYHHDEYMAFFRQFFENYLSEPNIYFNNQELLNAIYKGAGLKAVKSLLAKDVDVDDPILKELVLINGLRGLYFKAIKYQAEILSLLIEISKESTIAANKNIAENLVYQLSYLKPGTIAPNIELSDLNGNTFQLNAENQKATFLHFFTFPCASCDQEMDSISVLYEMYKDRVDFVGVAINATVSNLKNFLSEKGYQWSFVLSENPFELAEIFQLNVLPSYILVDEKGIIKKNPALVPWEGFQGAFKLEFR